MANYTITTRIYWDAVATAYVVFVESRSDQSMGVTVAALNQASVGAAMNTAAAWTNGELPEEVARVVGKFYSNATPAQKITAVTRKVTRGGPWMLVVEFEGEATKSGTGYASFGAAMDAALTEAGTVATANGNNSIQNAVITHYHES